MIKLRLKTFDSDSREQTFKVIPGEFLDKTVKRVLAGVPLGERSVEEVFQALHNGHSIPPEIWSQVKVCEGDAVLIAPRLKGDNQSIFKQFATLLVVIAVSSIPGLSPLAAGLLTAGAALATTLVLNALIPPPAPDGLSQGAEGLSDSQMYSISSQSNVARKFQTVPKVYGAHRMYPVVAATPYTEVQVDPTTKEKVEYLYALYDFGLGPNFLSDFRIGDTPISAFSDVTFNVVDPLKPAVTEGVWDNQSRATFQFYKSDNAVENVGVVLNGNQDEGGPLDTYELIRAAGNNPDNVSQEISLTLVNPRGLYSYSTTGALFSRTINVQIQFAVVGTSTWRGFNDPSYVSASTLVGGDLGTDRFKIFPIPILQGRNGDYLTGEYTTIGLGVLDVPTFGAFGYPGFPFPGSAYIRQVGYRKNTSNALVLRYSTRIQVGTRLYFGDKYVGKVSAVAAHSVVEGVSYYKYTLSTFLTENIIVYQIADNNGFITSLDVHGNIDGYGYVTNHTKEVLNGWDHNRNLYPLPLKTFYSDTSAIGNAVISRASTSPVFSTFKFTPKQNAEYKVRVLRTRSYSDYTFQTSDELTVASLRTSLETNPIITDKRHTFVELKIKATGQLQGSISTLSAVCQSVLDVYDPNTQTWNKGVTNNPAWVFVDLLTGEINKRAQPKSRLDMDSIVEWADFCDELPASPSNKTYVFPRFLCNYILDYSITLQSALAQVCSMAQAGFNLVDGKYGVLIDRERTVPVQVFTPRNSRAFSSTRNYTRQPHGVKVTFVDPTRLWQTSELVVYADGYSKVTADEDEVDDLIAFACTNEEQAFRFGRYMLAQNRLRQETITIEVDFEYLICTRGDFVQITQDTMRVGGSPARVRSVVGNRVTIDDSLETVAASYGFVFRGVDGTVVTDTLTIINSNTFDLAGAEFPAVGDLIVIGVVDSIVLDCIVKAIAPLGDLSATLTLVEKADAIYAAESLDTFPEYDPQINIPLISSSAPSEVTDLVVSDSGYICNLDRTGYDYYIDIDWEAGLYHAAEFYEVFVDSGLGFKKVGETRDTDYRHLVDYNRLGNEHTAKVIGVSANGKRLSQVEVDGVANTPEVKTDLPPSVTKLVTDITNEVIQLSWDKVDDCGISEYLIRYSPDTTSVWESSVPLLKIDKNTNLASTQARTGIYHIKAVDFEGNVSLTAASAITTVPNLFNLNVIESRTDFPDLDGTYDRVEELSGAIILQKETIGAVGIYSFYNEGYYVYEGFLDLGEIYTVRLQSQIQAEGLTDEDIMENWDPLSDVLALSTAGASDWDVEVQYRSTNTFNVMSDWSQLSLIDPLDEGNQENFTEWRKFVMGDATGRIFQFRLKLVSNRASVTARVFDGTIKVDMPDRVESYNDIVVPAIGYALAYDPAFKGPGTSPNIQVSIDGAQSGDYFEITNKALTGFDIQVFDSSDTAVERQLDIAVKGFGRKAVNII